MENEQEAATIFKNVSDYLIQTGKTVIVTTTNEQVCGIYHKKSISLNLNYLFIRRYLNYATEST